MKAFAFLSLAALVSAAPLHNPRADSSNSPAATLITSLLASDTSNALITLTSAQETTLNIQKAAVLASVAYCSVVRQASWTCPLCTKYIPDMQLLYENGDGGATPYVYIGYSPSLNWLVVSHEGTNTSSLESWINDAEFALTTVDSSLKATTSAEVDDGFQTAYLRTNTWVLSSFTTALKTYTPNLILVTGHSLGAAISTLTAVYLKLNLATTIPIQQIGFGQPRVGNSAWVTYYESVMGNNQMRVTNYDDIVPHLPPELLGYEQPDNEIWITTAGGSTLVLCPGVENGSCGDQFLIDSSSPHDGPYLGIDMDAC